MKNLRLLLLVMVLFSSALLAAAERIGVVNYEQVFREYYKSRIAEQFINQRAEALRSYLGQMNGHLEAFHSDARRLGANALNPALSADERNKAQQAAEDAAKAVRAKEAEIKLYTSESSREMRALENRKRAEIIADIRAEVTRRAAAEGYAFVFDCSGKTMNGEPALLVYPEKNNITQSVIRELNRTASKAKTEGKSK
jgi:Skp family chaperone for outer membrane proteins